MIFNIITYRQPLPDDEQAPQQDQPATPEQNEEQDEQAPNENYCDFTVYISDKSGNKGIVVEATSMDTEISFNSLTVSEDIHAQKALHRFERQIKGYAGPDFSTLDERIQTAMTEYLEGYGVNEHLAAFIECMSLDKDQRLYMKWLGSLKDFVNQ